VLTSSDAHKVANPDSYWIVNEASPQALFVTLLRLFAPACGILSKSKEQQWPVMQKKIMPLVSRTAIDAKEEEYRRRLTVIDCELTTCTELQDNNHCELPELGGEDFEAEE
jgi:hypothetical protein